MLEQQRRQDKASARWDGPLAITALATIVVLLLLPPHGLLDKADQAAFAVCHRLPQHSFTVSGRALPLCARCSGTYLGALAALLVLMLRGRGRADTLPASKHLVVLAAFMIIWAMDGLNSLLGLAPGLPHLYEPGNILRLVSGTLEGLAIAAVALPLFNLSLWANPEPVPSVGSWRDLAWMLVGGTAVVGLVSSQWPPTLYPLALISSLAVVALMGLVNTMLVLTFLRRNGQIRGWRQAITPLLIGVALALVELRAMGVVRSAIEAWAARSL